MSGETESYPSEWTPDLLYLHLLAIIDKLDQSTQHKLDATNRLFSERHDAQQRAMDAALAASKEAVDKANTANERRFDSVNEFRGQLNDVMSMMLPRAEADSRFKAVDEKLDAIQRTLDRSTSGYDATRSTTQQNWAMLVGAAGVV